MIRTAILTLLGLSFGAAQTHVSPMAGRWFPAETQQLRHAVDRSYLASARRTGATPARKGLLALVVPHAGLDYSGTIAAAAYSQIGSPPNVILLAFSHRVPMTQVVAPNVTAYSTAAGAIRVNSAAIAELGVPLSDEKTLCDHSLENQLPFLSKAAPNAQLIPLYVGSLSLSAIRPLARKLAARLEAGDLLIASSDFTHYGEAYRYTPFPNNSETAAKLRDRATDAFEEISSLDVAHLDEFLARTGDTICGRDPIRLLMATLAAYRDEVYMTDLDTMLSGDLTHDYSLSVTYGALAFHPASSFTVSDRDQRLLVKHSRTILDAYLASENAASLAAASTDLRQRTGVFVTIRKQGELRGCIGTLAPKKPLPETVADRTIAAAASDPRFRSLSREEGPVTLEVSLLTPLKRIPSWRAYRDGLGAVLMLDNRGGLLLPQVAREMGWSATQFLEGLAQKAGLPPNAYQSPKARLYVFRAQVFGE